MFRVVFIPPRNWESQYPDAQYATSDGSPCASRAYATTKFWTDARRLLRRFVKTMRLAPHADRVIGLHLDRAEWFVPEDGGYDSSRAAQAQDSANGHERGIRMTKANACELAWFDGRASFDSIGIPRAGSEVQKDEFVRSSRRDRRFVDYHLLPRRRHGWAD